MRPQRFYSAEFSNMVSNIQNGNPNKIQNQNQDSNNKNYQNNNNNEDYRQNNIQKSSEYKNGEQQIVKTNENNISLDPQNQTINSKKSMPIKYAHIQSANKKQGGHIIFSMNDLLKDPTVKQKIQNKILQKDKIQQNQNQLYPKSPQNNTNMNNNNSSQKNQVLTNFANLTQNQINVNNNNTSQTCSNKNIQELNNFLEENFGILTKQKQQQSQKKHDFINGGKTYNQTTQF